MKKVWALLNKTTHTSNKGITAASVFSEYLHQRNAPFTAGPQSLSTSDYHSTLPVHDGTLHDLSPHHPRKEAAEESFHRAAPHPYQQEALEEEKLLRELRRNVNRVLTEKQSKRLKREFLDTYKIVKHVAKECDSILAPYRVKSNNNNDSAEDNKNQFNLDLFLFERSGQLKNTFSALTANHYKAVGHLPYHLHGPPDKHKTIKKSDRLLLEQFASYILFITRFNYAAPTLSLGTVSPQEAETFIKNSGLRTVLRDVLRELLLHHVLTANATPNHSAVLRLFYTVLSLPPEDSPRYDIPHAPLSRYLAQDGEGSVFTHLSIEEWCLRYWVEKELDFMNQHKEDSIFYTPGEGDKNSGRLSISAAVDVVRASFLSSDQSTGKDYFYHYKFLLHHRLHHRNGHLGLFYVSHTPSGDALSLRVPYRLGKEFTSLLIGHLAKHNKENSNLSVHHIASLCSAILFYKLENEVSLNFLVSSVRVLLEDDRYILLRGYEVCQVLLAYAMLNFKGDLSHLPQYKANTTNNNRGSSSNFYVLLGQRAGALADYLTEKDILSVLSVIDMVSAFDGVHKGETSEKDNDHKSNVFSNLRKTLESSIRIRSLHRKVQYDTV